MKKLATLVLFLALLAHEAFTQDGLNVFESKWNIIVYDKGNIPAYAGDDISADITYTDTGGNPIYTESHAGTLDDNSFISFILGKGSNQLPFPPNAEIYKRISGFSWIITVQTDNGPKIINGDEDLKPGIWSTYSSVALDSEGLGGNQYVPEPSHFKEVFSMEDDPAWSVMLQRNADEPPSNTINPFPLSEFVQFGTATSEVNGKDLHVFRMGMDNRGDPEEDCYPFFGPFLPFEIEGYWTFCRPFLRDVYNLFHLKIDDDAHPPVPGGAPRDHNTSALYAENNSPDLSAGVLAKAGTWGVYASGQNGVVGISSGDKNGAGITGFVGAAPATGGFKYGIYANSNSVAGAIAAAIFGSGFYTGTWLLASDERLKADIRTHTNMIDKVMKLRPTSYQYRQDTPYGFTQGLHHGFIAQEIETVMPELVADMQMPSDLDPQRMQKSTAIEYKGINYPELIPVLTSAIQELNTTLIAQAAEIAELKKAIKKLQENK